MAAAPVRYPEKEILANGRRSDRADGVSTGTPTPVASLPQNVKVTETEPCVHCRAPFPAEPFPFGWPPISSAMCCPTSRREDPCFRTLPDGCSDANGSLSAGRNVGRCHGKLAPRVATGQSQPAPLKLVQELLAQALRGQLCQRLASCFSRVGSPFESESLLACLAGARYARCGLEESTRGMPASLHICTGGGWQCQRGYSDQQEYFSGLALGTTSFRLSHC